ncbi:putative disease resistance protein At1g50180 isoform X2 [Chenopodium quinoa]|uniref:putative disease resistance protein At1g50180 isoform X2 n=1 Tax=Chenopodium quinoa TaxID=63459 RepID=UPI000B796594|nr:putative disease resistance protein At1g50180 isoform X2 [Chenopodium quinoa]
MEAMVLLKAAGQQLGKWMVEEAKHLYAVKDKVEGLQSELEWIQCFLRNADEKHGDDELVQKWISEVNDFSYEAEDILEKYLLKVSNPRKKDEIWSLIKWATCALGDAISTHEVGCEIDVLSSKISKLAKRMKTYGVTPASSSSLSLDEMRCIHPHLPVDDIIGLEDDTNVLINHLMNRETKVIAISGMPGSGKTTLARKVYLTVKGHQFKMCAWVYVSLEFQPRNVIIGILLSLYADDKTERNLIQNMGPDDLEKKLYDVLKEKKCLVVLDDLWEASDWNRLKNAFSIEASSSKLMITTRNTALLSSVDPRGVTHEPKGLSPEDSWKLFRRKAFLDMKDICTRDPGMKDLGSKMIKRCNGLPLAIAVLGGLLAPKKTLKEWERVNKTFLRDNNDVVTKVLELSYTSLPYHLKPCFLHLGNFPEDSEIPTKKLYRMWIAEGIVAPRNDKPTETLEDTANSYLQELVHRCIVQVGKLGPAGRIRTCRLHDLMRHMCVKKAKEKNFLSIASHEGVDVGCSSSVIRDGNLHRVAVHFDQISLPSQSDKTSHLRSLMFFGSGPIYKGDHQGWLKEMISDFKLLRILDLENTGIEEVPRVIGNLIHLRYLSIMGTQVTTLPSTLRNLRCLQTLDLRVSLQQNCVLTIPNVLWRMKELNYLYLPSHAYKVKRFQKLRVKGLSSLKILKNFDTTRSQVNNLHKLENLRKLCIKNEPNMY